MTDEEKENESLKIAATLIAGMPELQAEIRQHATGGVSRGEATVDKLVQLAGLIAMRMR